MKINTVKISLRYFLDLLWIMTQKELRARYKYTILGFFWLVANPVLQMAVIGFVFTFFMREPVKYYYYYLFTGLLVWNFFSLSLNKATPSLVFERELIKKSVFPRAIIPLSIILSNLIHLIAALMLFLIPLLFINTLSLSTIPTFFFGFVLLLMFTIGVCLLTSALNVRYRDINFFVQALLIIWFYATPIIYSFLIIPREFIWLWRLNPMTSILQLFQNAFIRYPAPGPAMLTVNITVIIVVLALGIYVFTKESKNFDDWL
jgi:lipopolysaccharide transport system permease protein